MFKKFLMLEWKSFFRSASVGKSIALKIFLGFVGLYFFSMFLIIGFSLYEALKHFFPDNDALQSFNKFVLLWLLVELVYRFFLQSLPVVNIRPLMTLPVQRKQVLHFVLLKSLFSFYNLLSLSIIIPFGIIYYNNESISGISITAWIIAMIALILTVNYANFLIKKKFAENIKAFLPYILVALVLAVMEYYNIFSVTQYTGKALDFLVRYPVLAIVPIALLAGAYIWNFTYLRNNFYLDASLKARASEATNLNLGWTKYFGEIAPFLTLDIKLILRNKRPRSTLMISVLFLLYGLMFYSNIKGHDESAMLIMSGIFLTGMFMIQFGQFIPAWDSSYYSMIMSQNIPVKKYLASKAGLITFSVIVLTLLTLPYGYISTKIVIANLACAVYNIGINVPMLLLFGAYNKKKIDLDKSPFFNYQGTGATQWLVGIPLFIIPILLYYACMEFMGFNAAIITLACVGLVGIILRRFLMDKIAEVYKEKKYAAISGFKEQEA